GRLRATGLEAGDVRRGDHERGERTLCRRQALLRARPAAALAGGRDGAGAAAGGGDLSVIVHVLRRVALELPLAGGRAEIVRDAAVLAGERRVRVDGHAADDVLHQVKG